MGLRKLLWYASIPFIFAGCGKEESPVEPLVNHPPVIERIVANPDEVFPEEISRLECIARDEDGDVLDYRWDNDGGYFSDLDDNKIVWNSPSDVGEYHVTVEVDDGQDRVLGNELISVVSRFDTILVSQDVFVDGYAPNTNFQNDTAACKILWIFEDSVGRGETYSKFDFDPKGDIKSAKLKLTLVPIEDLYENHLRSLSIDIHELEEPWIASTATWNTRPNYNLTPIKRFVAPSFSRDPVTIYVEGMEDLVRDLINNPLQNYGIALVPVQWNTFKVFYSMEGAQEKGDMNLAPAFIIEYE